jgi:hypothetical protein
MRRVIRLEHIVSVTSSASLLRTAAWRNVCVRLGEFVAAFAVRLPAWLASIMGLFQSRGPSYVARLVAAIVVNAVDGVYRRWTRPDFRVKRGVVRKRHCQSTPAIVGVVPPISTRTATFHAEPGVVFRRAGVSVFPVYGPGDLAIQTATAFRMAVFQVNADHWNLAPAIAPAQPPRMGIVRSVAPQHGQSREYLASQIASVHNRPILAGTEA